MAAVLPVSILYAAANETAFLQYYRETHLPILKRFPGIKSIRLLTPAPVTDSQSVEAGNFLLVVEMLFETRESLWAALASTERKEAREDFSQFQPVEGDIWHQAMEIEEYKFRVK